jgi:methionyl-tRNA synthetase
VVSFNLHIIGKDILRISMLFNGPAMPVSAGLSSFTKTSFGHGLLTTKDLFKMGKTLGNTSI